MTSRPSLVSSRTICLSCGLGLILALGIVVNYELSISVAHVSSVHEYRVYTFCDGCQEGLAVRQGLFIVGIVQE